MAQNELTEEIRARLFHLQDLKYRDFESSLNPVLPKECFIGVRTPALRTLAKEFVKREDIALFLDGLPHEYFEENQLHAFILSLMKDYDECVERIEEFLPFVETWATCDQLNPKVFKKTKERLAPKALEWMKSDQTYTIRFGIRMLMQHFLDEDFDVKYLNEVADLRSEEYYVNMMIAWFFATALTKQWEAALLLLEAQRLDVWTHNKSIQKAVESYRVPEERKTYLKTLRRKGSMIF